MTDLKLVGVILAGGSGNRLWPISRSNYPKQFQSFSLRKSLFQNTVNRATEADVESIMTICNEDHKFLVEDELDSLNIESTLILEPHGRNTAPAITLAALSIEEDALMLVMPSDHYISSPEEFNLSIKSAIPIANSGKLVTFGVPPKSPHTGYGYIKSGDSIDDAFKIDKFTEKPSLESAKGFLKEGSYFWNSGIFLFKKSVFLREMQNFRADILEFCERSMKEKTEKSNYISPDAKSFAECPSESIDYAIMEHTLESAVVPLSGDWNDLGSWKSLLEVSEKDDHNNLIDGDVVIHDTRDCYLHSEDRLLVTNGISNLVVVSTKDSLLVSDMNSTENIKLIIEDIKKESRKEAEIHREVRRPWGSYDSIDSGEGFQVKRITVKPRGLLSLQKHQFRSEHWTVVSGQAKVTIGDEIFTLDVNESTYIPAQEIHRLENICDEDLVIIEVQIGSYTGEDDIIRIEDVYGR